MYNIPEMTWVPITSTLRCYISSLQKALDVQKGDFWGYGRPNDAWCSSYLLRLQLKVLPSFLFDKTFVWLWFGSDYPPVAFLAKIPY